MEGRNAIWYFDYVSPFAYIHSQLLARLDPKVSIEPRPILFAGLLKHFGHLGPAEIPPKRRFTYRYITWLAARHGIPLAFPGGHPFNPLGLLRLTLATDGSWETVHRLFAYAWKDGHLPGEEPHWSRLLSELGVDDTELGNPQVKQELRRNTDEAVEKGVFGVPAIAFDGHLFWGVDATEMFLDYVADPSAFSSPELDRLDRLPEAAKR